MKSLHICLVHDSVIPPPKYGGTERLLYWLSKALIHMGHQVSLICKSGSLVPGVQIIPLDQLKKGESWEDLVPSSVDILHLSCTPQNIPKKPFLVTIGGNGQLGETFHPNTVFVSLNHAQNHGSTHFVYNGLDPDEFPMDEKREPYLVFLAKASWKVKNLQGAIEIARSAGMRLEVLGSRNWPLGLHKILPAWGGVRYHGMLGDLEKRQILRKAYALLFPVRWHEPFGIAITEALVSGCPVFGTPYGSLPEIISPDVGFLGSGVEEIAHAVRSKTFSPQVCRSRVLKHFTHLEMAKKYLMYYERILTSGCIGQKDEVPKYQFQKASEELLPFQF